MPEWVGLKYSNQIKRNEIDENCTTIPEMRTIIEKVYEEVHENDEVENMDSGDIEAQNDMSTDQNIETEENEVEDIEDVGITQVRCISSDQVSYDNNT